MSNYNGQMILRPEQPTNNNQPVEEPELQWLEDGVNYLCGLMFQMLAKLFMLVLTAGFQIYAACRQKQP